MATKTTTHTEVPSGGKPAFPPFAKETFASQIVWLVITFVALYLLISRVAIPRIGGIMEARLIAGMAEAYYCSVAPHNPLGPISLASGLQLAASVPNFLCQEQVSLGDGYIKEPFKVEDGHVRIPTKPGLGVELDDNLMADKIGHDWQNAETYLESDGSVTDW